MFNETLANPGIIVVGAAGFEPAASWSRRTRKTFLLISSSSAKPREYGIYDLPSESVIPFDII